jgi:hypothetical protein
LIPDREDTVLLVDMAADTVELVADIVAAVDRLEDDTEHAEGTAHRVVQCCVVEEESCVVVEEVHTVHSLVVVVFASSEQC